MQNTAIAKTAPNSGLKDKARITAKKSIISLSFSEIVRTEGILDTSATRANINIADIFGEMRIVSKIRTVNILTRK